MDIAKASPGVSDVGELYTRNKKQGGRQMEAKIYLSKKGALIRTTIPVHDEKTGEEFECELPWHRIALVRYVLPRPPISVDKITLSDGKVIDPVSIRTLYAPPTKEYPHGRAIRVDDLPKICIRYETDQGDIYLAPDGFSWTSHNAGKWFPGELEQLRSQIKEREAKRKRGDS